MLDGDPRTLQKNEHLPAHHGVRSPTRPSQADRAERYLGVGFQGALLQVQLLAIPLQLLSHRGDVLPERQVVVLTVHVCYSYEGQEEGDDLDGGGDEDGLIKDGQAITIVIRSLRNLQSLTAYSLWSHKSSIKSSESQKYHHF